MRVLPLGGDRASEYGSLFGIRFFVIVDVCSLVVIHIVVELEKVVLVSSD